MCMCHVDSLYILGVQFPLFENEVQDGRLKEICEQTMPEATYHKYKKQWHKMIKKTLEELLVESNNSKNNNGNSPAHIPFSYQQDAQLQAYRSMPTFQLRISCIFAATFRVS